MILRQYFFIPLFKTNNTIKNKILPRNFITEESTEELLKI